MNTLGVLAFSAGSKYEREIEDIKMKTERGKDIRGIKERKR